jgi:hypothetical protein
MIDSRRLYRARHRGMGKQQQRQTVRPARNGQAQPAATAVQCSQIGRETRDQ